MTTPSISDSPKLIGKRDAYHNHETFKKYNSELAANRKTWLGVYRGHQFVLIKEKDGIFDRLKFLLQRLFRLISIDQGKIQNLHQISEDRYKLLTPSGQIERFKAKYLKHKSRATETNQTLTALQAEHQESKEKLTHLDAGLKKALESIKTWQDEFDDKVRRVSLQKKEEAGEEVRVLKLKLEAAEKRAEQDLQSHRKDADEKLEEVKKHFQTKMQKLQGELEANNTIINGLLKKEQEFKAQLKEWKADLKKSTSASTTKPQEVANSDTSPPTEEKNPPEKKHSKLHEFIHAHQRHQQKQRDAVEEPPVVNDESAVSEELQKHHHHLHGHHSHKKQAVEVVENEASRSDPTPVEDPDPATIEHEPLRELIEEFQIAVNVTNEVVPEAEEKTAAPDVVVAGEAPTTTEEALPETIHEESAAPEDVVEPPVTEGSPDGVLGMSGH